MDKIWFHMISLMMYLFDVFEIYLRKSADQISHKFRLCIRYCYYAYLERLKILFFNFCLSVES